MAVGMPKEKIEVLHHGIDEDVFCPGKISKKTLENHPQLKGKKRVIFNPARMGLAKGCDVTISAFHLVKNKFPDAFLIMSGSGNIIDWGLTQNKDIAYFMSLIKHLNLEDSVYINTFSINEEMPDLYRLASVIVYASSSEEPFGLAMLEAMASSKPIIVSESGGMPEIIKDDINGYVVPKRNHEALAERVINLLSDEELKIRLGETGRKQVEEMYTKRIYAKKVFRVYEEAVKNYMSKGKKYKSMVIENGATRKSKS